ncbi:MAG: ATP-binding protein [Sphingomonadaceae bacterium]
MLMSRRANLFVIVEITAILSIGLMIWATWASFTNAPENGQLLPSGKVAVLLIGTLIPSMALLVLWGRRLALRRAAGSTARLHVRLVFFFSIVAAVPTLLVAAFAAFLFQSGVDFWFSDNSRGLMENANEMARGYYEQNQLEVGNETTTMAGDVRFYLSRIGNVTPEMLADKDFAEFMNYQMQGRDLNESVILQRVNGNAMRVAASYNLTAGNDPTTIGQDALRAFAAGAPVYVSADVKRLEAIAPIDLASGVFLYNARNSEAASFRSWQQAEAISSSYDILTRRARALQLRFNLALYFVSLALVGLSVWFALRFADRQVEPLTDLVAAARKVGAGNFAMRVDGRTGTDEIGQLNRAFNRMASQIEKQTDALVGANRELDERRSFMEAVLESITSGIISLGRDNRIVLMNSAANKLLLEDGESSPIGKSLGELVPEFAELLETGSTGGIVSQTRDGELMTLAVQISAAPDGVVLTFEDITRQLLDQRQAAWSDVARRIAHEIKNPLTPIQLATERIRRRYRRQIDSDGELFDELTSTIIRQVGDLRKMVDEFSSFARLPKPVFRKEDMLDLVRQAIFLQEVAHPQIAFSLDCDTQDDLLIACDRHQLGQAMTNILKNAVEAVEARIQCEEPDYRGRIQVELSASQHEISVMVEDNGIGLPKDRERIVEPYVTTREKGTGLGLAIVNKIVEEHGGEMSFTSGMEGGTRVCLTFARDPRILQQTAAE